MSQSVKELEALLADLDAKIRTVRKAESASALTKVHELVSEFGFTQKQLFPFGASAKNNREPKYRDHESGMTWTGLGRPPAWIAGKDVADFLIDQPRKNDGPYLAEMAAAKAR